MKVIALEEHYGVPEISGDSTVRNFDAIRDRLLEIGENRIKYMDATGIDIQILSYGNGNPQELPTAQSIELCKKANDYLYETMKKYPTRFYGFASLPVGDPEAAAKELKRCVEELGFKGAEISGYAHEGRSFDDAFYFPIYEMAANLEVPIYFHPGPIDSVITNHYFAGNWDESLTDVMSAYGYGWHMDTGILAIRLILAGVFDRYPAFHIISGHWGEFVPMFLERMDAMTRLAKTDLKKRVSEYYRQHVYVTPSGMYTYPQMKLLLDETGIDHLMFATDYPYVYSEENTACFLKNLPLTEEEKLKFCSQNAEKLLKLND